jgi:hypothetical protein
MSDTNTPCNYFKHHIIPNYGRMVNLQNNVNLNTLCAKYSKVYEQTIQQKKNNDNNNTISNLERFLGYT